MNTYQKLLRGVAIDRLLEDGIDIDDYLYCAGLGEECDQLWTDRFEVEGKPIRLCSIHYEQANWM